MSDGSQTHIVGPAITWYGDNGPHIRQRCSWCGALIRDDLTARMMVPIEDADWEIPDWPVGELIRLEGNGWPWVRSIIETEVDENGDRREIEQVAPDACLLLDPEITR